MLLTAPMVAHWFWAVRAWICLLPKMEESVTWLECGGAATCRPSSACFESLWAYSSCTLLANIESDCLSLRSARLLIRRSS